MNDEYERHLLDQLFNLQKEYTKLAQPIIERLATYRSMQPPQPFFIPSEEAQKLGIIIKEKLK